MESFKHVFARIVHDVLERQGVARNEQPEMNLLPAAAGAKGDLIPSDIPFLGDINSIGEGIPDLASVLPGVSIAPTQLLPTAISLTGVPTLSTPTILLTPSDSASTPSLASVSSSSQSQESASSTPSPSATPTPTPSELPASLPSSLSVPSTSDSPNLAAASSLPVSSSIPAASSTPSPSIAISTNWFTEHKSLSITVLTLSSLLALILFVTLATWCIRRSRRDRFKDLTLDFSPEELAGPADVEKGDALSNLASPTPPRPGRSTQGARRKYSREMYEQTGYPALPVFIPQMHFENNTSLIRSPEPSISPFHRLSHNLPQLPNPFDSPPFVPGVTPSPKSGSQTPRSGRSPNFTRKPPPPLLQVNIPVYSGLASPAMGSSVSLTAPPMQVTSSVNPANPKPLDSPQSGSPNQTSLLNPSRTPTTPSRVAMHTHSYSRKLDPTMLGMPVASLLPYEFGSSPDSQPSEVENQPTHPLKVINQ